MKILFISPEFEEKGRGITGIIKSMINAAKAAGHDVGIVAGYPDARIKESALLDEKVEHIYLQHYIRDGKASFENIYPGGLRNKRNLAKILKSRSYFNYREFTVQQKYFNGDPGILKNIDFCIKIPFCYQFINHSLGALPVQILKMAIKKHKVDLVITGNPMELSKKDVYPARLGQFVHDTMPIDLVETPADNKTPIKFAKQLYAAASKSDVVFTNSKDTSNKVREVNSTANIHTVFGIPSSPKDNIHETAILQNKELVSGKFLLFISVIERRKNIERLLEAYALVAKEIAMPLVIVGGKGHGYTEIMEKYDSLSEPVRKNVIFTGYISEADKYTLLNHARAFVFPSIYEGIGLPVIEAYASNLPVLTSRRGALPEAGGEAALYVEDPYNIKEIARKIKQIALDEEKRATLLKHVSTQTAKFTTQNFNTRFKAGLESLETR